MKTSTRLLRRLSLALLTGMLLLIAGVTAKAQPGYSVIDNLKSYKWRSMDSFTDSTMRSMKEIWLVKCDPADTSKLPVMWVENDVLKIRFDNATIAEHHYTFDEHRMLRITAEDKKKALVYKTSTVSTGSFMLLRVPKKYR